MKARNYSTARKGAKSRFFKNRAGLQGGNLYAVVAVTIIALLAVPSFVIYQSFGGGGGANSQTTTSSSSTGPSGSEQAVLARIHDYSADFSNLDVNKMGALYANSGVLVWHGPAINSSAPFNGAGSYSGAALMSFYTTLFNNLVPAGGLQHPIGYSLVLTEALPTQVSTKQISSTVVNSTFNLYLNFSSGLFGDVGAKVIVHQQWTSQSSGGTTSWYMSRDDWDFTYSYIQYPVNTAAAK